MPHITWKSVFAHLPKKCYLAQPLKTRSLQVPIYFPPTKDTFWRVHCYPPYTIQNVNQYIKGMSVCSNYLECGILSLVSSVGEEALVMNPISEAPV